MRRPADGNEASPQRLETGRCKLRARLERVEAASAGEPFEEPPGGAAPSIDRNADGASTHPQDPGDLAEDLPPFSGRQQVEQVGDGHDVELAVGEREVPGIAHEQPPAVWKPWRRGKHRRRTVDAHNLGRPPFACKELAQQAACASGHIEKPLVRRRVGEVEGRP